MAKFFASGLSQGEKGLSIVDTVAPHDLRQALRSMGINLEDDGRMFATAENDAAYCPGGSFQPDTLLAGVAAFCNQARDEGFAGGRVSGDMSWAVRNGVGTSDLLKYEVKATDYVKTCPCIAVCEYDARKFDGATLMDVLSVHPVMIVRGQAVKNPYYVPAKEFLAGHPELGA